MFGEFLRLALTTLVAHRLRSTLTVLSIAIGVSAVILLTSLAKSGLSTLVRGIEDIGGSRFIMLWQDQPKKAAAKAGNDTRGLNRGDVLALAHEIPLIAKIACYETQQEQDFRRLGSATHTADLIQADEGFLDLYAYRLAAGRGLVAQDLEGHAHVTVVGEGLAKAMFPHEEAVGQELIYAGERYRVVGRLAHAGKSGSRFGWDWDDVAMVPLTIAHPDGKVTQVAMQSSDQARNTELLDVANAILLARHNQVDDFQFLDFGGMLKGFYTVFYGMIVVVGAIAGMSLVIGGVGIMNIMLVAIAERQSEIGLRKAVGATRAAILSQFLIEAVVLSLFGALIGTLVGVGLALAAVRLGPMIYPDWVGQVDMGSVAVAVVAAASTGLFFGWYPARLAAAADPIASLRAE